MRTGFGVVVVERERAQLEAHLRHFGIVDTLGRC
jgi:hypothetical protein